jgi:hypothetical protein
MAVKRAFAREAGLSFSTFSVNDSEFHLFFLSMAAATRSRKVERFSAGTLPATVITVAS